MSSVIAVLARALAGAVGASLIYASLFLYEEEEGGVQNAIERAWQRIRSLHGHAISKQTAFLKVVALITAGGFDHIFGKRLFGLKAVAASACYSVAALIVGAGIAASLQSMFDRKTAIVGTCLFLLFVVAGSLGPFFRRPTAKITWLSCVLVAVIAWIPLFNLCVGESSFGTGKSGLSIPFFCAVPVAIGCDFLFILLTRLMLAQAAKSSSFIRIALLAMSNAVIAFALCVIPVFLSLELMFIHDFASASLGVLGLSNSLDALVSVTFLLVGAAMLVHRLIWPFIERPMYAMYRHHVLTEHKKTVFFAGVALLGVAIPSVGRILDHWVRL